MFLNHDEADVSSMRLLDRWWITETISLNDYHDTQDRVRRGEYLLPFGRPTDPAGHVDLNKYNEVNRGSNHNIWVDVCLGNR